LGFAALVAARNSILGVEEEMSSVVAPFLFWVSAAVVFYVYFGYPLLLLLVARRRDDAGLSAQPLPRVTIFISAYNEKAVIAQKLENSLQLDYPRQLLQIIVVSDSSDDGTDEIVLRFAVQGVRLVRQQHRSGKSAGLNLGFKEATGDILVYSDANAIYQPDAVRRLVGHFGDPRVGYVVGNARYLESERNTPSAESEGLYWKLETWLKKKESAFGSVVGGDGALYAIRRELFTELCPTDINDLLHPLQSIVRGYRGVYEPAAICYESAGDSFEKEFRRKVRIVSRSFHAVQRASRVLLPWTQFRHWLCLVSHKILRWFVPFFLILILLSSFLLRSHPFFLVAVLAQAVFYALASVGWLAKGRGPRAIYVPYYFCVVNLAALLGLIKSFSGSLSSTWQTVRYDEIVAQDSVARLAGRGS
jgi:cellulose synthase/poly-beta-1,6-N-acetylglucosamine synthase-like glycosyltransferase